MIDVFFKLIRSGLYGTELSASDFPDNINWKQIINLAQSQTLEGVLADAVMRLPSGVKVPAQVKSQLMDKAFKIAKSHTLLDNNLEEVVSFFREEGIESVLLKGQGIARCYRNPTMRQCGDIDLFVGKENYEKASLLAHEKLENKDRTTYETPKHYHFNIGEVAIDLHHTAASSTPLRGENFQKWILSQLLKEGEFRYLEINGVQITLPPSAFDAFFIFYHAWCHLTLGGIGLRQLCDWAMVLNKYYDDLDLQELENALRRFRLMIPWQLFGNILVKYLGLPKEKMPFYNPSLENKSQIVLELILEGGNFGFFSKNHVLNLEEKPFLQRNWFKLRRTVRAYTNLFPVIPLDASITFVVRMSKGGLRTISKLIKGKK